MQLKTYAVYREKIYDAVLRSDDSVILKSFEAVDPSLGFELYKENLFIKTVSKSEIAEIYNQRFSAKYKGIVFKAWPIDDELIQLYTMKGDNKVLEMLHFQLVEKGVYTKVVSRDELDEITEIKELL